MIMLMLRHRLQVLIDDERMRRIEQEAQRRGVAVAQVVRDAIDDAVPGGRDARRDAGERILAAAPMPVPFPADLREELDAVRGRRA